MVSMLALMMSGWSWLQISAVAFALSRPLPASDMPVR